MSRLVLFNKPYGVLTQFTDAQGRPTLADFISLPGVYAAGRLDMDSEGLVVMTDDGALQARIADPRHKLPKTYWAQVEGIPTDEAVQRLMAGVDLGGFVTQPCRVHRMDAPPDVWERTPAVRYRAAIPTSWVEIVVHEGKNRQVRRMTAKVGFPTLRLIRWAVGEWTLDGLFPGQWREIAVSRQSRQLGAKRRVNFADPPGNWLLSDTSPKHKRKELP